MDSLNARDAHFLVSSPRSVGSALWLIGWLAAAAAFVLSGSVRADQLEQHKALVDALMNDHHANPLAADCAAHASFVISTLPLYQSVDFAPDALDDEHATIEPWNGAFGDGKQRVKVDTMVTIEGLGHRTRDNRQPDKLKIRCGYFENKLLAFDSNAPEGAPAKHGTRRRAARGWARRAHP